MVGVGCPRRIDRALVVGLVGVGVAALVYWLCARYFDAGRGDFFYLADAFLHGRTYLDFRPGPNDVIIVGDRFYVPFAPFPAIALMPLVAITGAVTADQLETGINALLAAAGVGPVLDAARPDRRRAAARPARADHPVRFLDADPVGHDARWGLAHRTADRDDPDAAAA